MKQQKQVTIVYDNIQVQDFFPSDITIFKMIQDFFNQQQHINKAISFFKKQGKDYFKMLNYQSAQLYLNSFKQGDIAQPCNKYLRLDQFQKGKRLKFYITKKNQIKQYHGKSKQQQIQKFQKINILQLIYKTNQNSNYQSLKIDLTGDKYQTIKDLLNYLRQKTANQNTTQFLLKHFDDQTIFTDATPDTNLRQFIKMKKINKIVAIPQYVAG